MGPRIQAPDFAGNLQARPKPRFLWGALALLPCIAGGLVGEQNPPVSPNPGSVSSSDAFVDEDDSTRITFENDGKATRESSSRIRIPSDAAVRRFGVLTFGYQSSVENVEVVSVRVLKPDGTVVTTSGENIQDMPAEITRQAPFYSDLREKHVSVKGLSVGDVLESRVVWRATKPLAPGEFWLSLDFPPDLIIQRYKIQVSAPRGRPLKWARADPQPVVTEEGDRRLITWSGSREAGSLEEKKADRQEAARAAARGRLPAAEIGISTFPSWEALGAWYNGLIRPRVEATAEIKAKAAELTKDARDEDAKIRAIYNYVSTQVRYIGVTFGIGRYQPHPAAEVLSNQYGDCKDKHTLLASLLAAAGIRAYPALIGSARLLDEGLPSPGQFDHMITAVPRGDGFLWLDTTPEVAPFGYLIGPLRDKRSLVVPSQGPALLVTTPADPLAPSLQTFRMDARLGKTGTLEGKAECSVSRDDTEILLRTAFRRTATAQWKDLVQLISLGSGFGGEVSDVSTSSAVNTDEPFRWSYKYERKDYSDWKNRRIKPPLPPMALPDSGETPSHPIWLGAPAQWHFESSVVLPEGSSPRLPPNRNLKEAFAEYTANYRFKDGILTADRRMALKRREVAAADFEAYRKFAKDVQDDQEFSIDLSAPPRLTPGSYQEAIWELPYSKNLDAARAYDNARAAAQKQDTRGAIESLKRAVAVDPEFTRAWLWMGELFRSQGKEELSLDAYRSAIRNDPREPLSYHVLAFNQLFRGRFEEAAGSWRRLTAVSPENREAFAFLGLVLLAAKRPREAAEALETAVKLDPDRAELSVQLGTAYIQLGEEAKALAAFRHGLEKDSPPIWLNEAADAMAEANKQLPLALEYAERAVRDEEKAASDVSLTHLKTEDLGHPVLLAACWDTLGWVHARMGRLERAKKYLNAAWVLAQTAAAGDHLGQIHERQGRPEDAARMYQLALAAGGTPAQRKETQARLDRIRSKSGARAVVRYPGEELTRLRTIKLPPVSTATDSAEFFLIIGPGAKALDVRFVSGAPGMKAAEKAIRAAAFEMPFPGEGPMRVLRRGLVSCSSVSGCSLVLYPPLLVRSVS